MKFRRNFLLRAAAAVFAAVGALALVAGGAESKGGATKQGRAAETHSDPPLPQVEKLTKPYAPLMAVVGGGHLGPFDDAQIRQIAETWKMVNSHAAMAYHDDPSRGLMPFWAGLSGERDAQGRTNLQRIKAVRPDFIFSNYRNGSYIAQFCPHEAAEVETRFPLAISIWNTTTTLVRDAGANDTTLVVTKYPADKIPARPPIRDGRPAYYPFKPSTTEAEHTTTTKAYVAWIRLGDELVRIDRIRDTDAGIELTVRRGLWGTTAASHRAGASVFQPVYIGRNLGIDVADGGLGGRPDDPSAQPGIRYALMTFDPKMHRWLGEKAKVIFDEGYDVCWLDVTVSTWYNNANPYGDEVRPWNIRKGEPLTQDDYRGWQQLKNDALYAMFPGKKFWINNVKGNVYFENGHDRYQLSGENGHHPVNGGSMEMYANHRGNEQQWRQTLAMTLDMVTSGFHGVAWSKGRNDLDYRRFSYATYLLAYRPGVELYFAIGEGGGLLNKPRDLFYYDLGTPTQHFKSVDEAESKTTKGVYARDFTQGRVVVNPGMEPKQIALGKAFVDSATGKRVNEVTLAGNTAAMLFVPKQ